MRRQQHRTGARGACYNTRNIRIPGWVPQWEEAHRLGENYRSVLRSQAKLYRCAAACECEQNRSSLCALRESPPSPGKKDKALNPCTEARPPPQKSPALGPHEGSYWYSRSFPAGDRPASARVYVSWGSAQRGAGEFPRELLHHMLWKGCRMTQTWVLWGCLLCVDRGPSATRYQGKRNPCLTPRGFRGFALPVSTARLPKAPPVLTRNACSRTPRSWSGLPSAAPFRRLGPSCPLFGL